ncbi:MAG: pseudouridine synthase, partial [Bradyrhizobium sp.]|nr:pseudouridine synthase [Bradyrhizobium sp.]
MPRDSDKNNNSPRGRRDRSSGGPQRSDGRKARIGAARGSEKKFAKHGLADKGDRSERKLHTGKREDGRPPRGDVGDRPQQFNRNSRPQGDRRKRKDDAENGGRRNEFRPREDRDGEKRTRAPRGDRPNYQRDDRPASRSVEKKFDDKRSLREGFRGKRERPDRPYSARSPRDGNRPERSFGDDKKFSRGQRDGGPRERSGDWRDRKNDRGDRKRDFGNRKRDAGNRERAFRDRSDEKPWQRRDDRGGEERSRFSRPREDRPKFDRPREARNAWQEHPRSERRSSDRFADRPRRDNEDDSKVFAKRPAFGGRGAYRERDPDERRPARPPRLKKSGERIAKVMSRHGLASRRDAEEWVVQGRVAVNGRVINSPALDVTVNDVITVDGKPLPPRERTRLFLFHKPRGLMTTHSDPEGRPTVFDHLPEGLPRLISVGRLDFNTEGLLLLTNDGGL